MLDASAAVELLLHTPAGARIAARLADVGSIHCPHLVDVEVMQTLRRLLLSGAIDPARTNAALHHWHDLDIQRHPHLPFLGRMWQMKDNLSAYDAAYVSLAEILDAPLVSGDQRLALAPGTRTRIEVFAGT